MTLNENKAGHSYLKDGCSYLEDGCGYLKEVCVYMMFGVLGVCSFLWVSWVVRRAMLYIVNPQCACARL